MSPARSAEYLAGVLRQICKLPRETEWTERKHNKAEPEEIGEYISALANSATLADKPFGYLAWGVEDGTGQVVGTTFHPAATKIGNEELESWLARLLTPRLHFRFFELETDGRHVVLLEIERASNLPVRFKDHEFIRVGTYKKKLKEFPEKERALWRHFDRMPFEKGVAVEQIGDDEVLRLLDYPSYFDLLGRALPDVKSGILEALEGDSLIARCQAGGWNITHLGALLFAKRLDDFEALRRKAVRVIVYRGTSRIETVKEQVGGKGYANGFEGLIGFINALVPSNEVIGSALRKTVPMYPELAIRELVPNALIHQDLFVTGAGPTVEIFDDRMEVTNPGKPLVDIDRFLDSPPKSRNEAIASLMRRMNICEERGSGIDKIVFQTELYQLPAPLFEVTGEFTRSVLFAHRPLKRMDREDRVRACYLHACLKYVNREPMTNTSVRERFGLDQQSSASASRLIREAVDANLIVPVDGGAAKKLMRYVPWWASDSQGGEAAAE